jgi:hypothetical protein
MKYTIAEVSKLVNLSKTSIYTKLKQKELQQHVTKKQGITYIDEIGLKLIQSSLKNFEDSTNYFKDKQPDTSMNDELATDTDYLNCLKEDIEYLKDQLAEKDNQLKQKDLQINNLNERLKQEQELTKNSQILLKDKPQQDIFLLEEHFQELDTKLEEVKNKMSDRKQQQEKKSFLTRIFKGKD